MAAAAIAVGCARSPRPELADQPAPAATHAPPTAGGVTTPEPPAPSGPVSPFPLVRVDREKRVVEFDGEVPIDAHVAEAPNVYLELIACTPDTREHESLVVTQARASHIHAALLMLGLEPGAPASWQKQADGSLKATPPSGAGVVVELVTKDQAGAEVVATPAQWIRHARTGEAWPGGSFVFAGSLMVTRQGEQRYDADWSGTVIGLTTFGTEVLAWRDVISPDSWVDEPVWIADARRVPKAGTPVVVRLRAE